METMVTSSSRATIKPEWKAEAKRFLQIEEIEEEAEIFVYFYYDQIFVKEYGKGKRIFIITVIPIDKINPERIAIPIFMINFSNHQKREIMVFCKGKKHKISLVDFMNLPIPQSQKGVMMASFDEVN